MIGWLLAFWRRLFGGYDAKLDFLEQRGIQCIVLIALVFCWEFFAKKFDIIHSLLIAFLVYMFFCKSHWYYFQCGMESDKYIDEELAKGRKPAMNWIVKPVNKWLGFEERSKRYCFVGLMIRYFSWSLPVACLVGWKFAVCGFCIPFIYNACYWVDFPKTKWCKSPTNWAEWFSGLIIGWGLI